MANHGRDFLDRKLQGAIAHPEDDAAGGVVFFDCQSGALDCADGVADGTVEDLGDVGYTGGELGFENTEV